MSDQTEKSAGLDSFYGIAQMDTSAPVQEIASGQQAAPETPAGVSAVPNSVQPPAQGDTQNVWSSFGDFKSQEDFSAHFNELKNRNEQYAKQIEQATASPFSNPLIEKLNEYVAKAESPESAIREYLEFQTTDFTGLSDDEVIKRARMRETGFGEDVVDILLAEEFATRPLEALGEVDPDWDWSERQEYEAKKKAIENSNKVTLAKKTLAAKKAREEFNRLKEETAVPSGFKAREEQNSLKAQKAEDFKKKLPDLTKDVDLSFNFGDKKEPFGFKLTDDHLNKVRDILPNVPGIEDYTPEQVKEVISHLAWGNPEIRGAMLASIYKHVETQTTVQFHADLGVNGSTQRFATGTGGNISEGLEAFYG